jgi:alpha-beta hydrolase superfamily lysophospholipase
MDHALAINTDAGTFESVDGIRVFFRSWHSSGKPRGIVVIVPGFNSHSGYYAWTGDRLASCDLAVYAFDLRGRGKSDGERFYVEKFTDYLSLSPGSNNGEERFSEPVWQHSVETSCP